MEVLKHRQPVSIFLNSSNEVYRQDIHCLYCGLPVVTIINYVVYQCSSDSGIGDEVLDFGPRLVIHCKRCGQKYRLHYKI